jgi:hypothetical protein
MNPNDLSVQDHRSVPEPPDQSKHPPSEGNAPSNSGLVFLSTTASSPMPDAGTPTHAFARGSNQTRRTSLAEVSLRTPGRAVSVVHTTDHATRVCPNSSTAVRAVWLRSNYRSKACMPEDSKPQRRKSDIVRLRKIRLNGAMKSGDLMLGLS